MYTMPTLEDFSKPDCIFIQKVELTAGVDPKEFLKAFTEYINGASTDLGHDSRFNLGRDISIRSASSPHLPCDLQGSDATTVNVVAMTTWEPLTAPFPLSVMFIILAARYQAAYYEHSEEAFHAVCWEHGTPDICDASESWGPGTGSEPGPFPVIPLTDGEQDHWDRVWDEDHTQPTQWHGTLPASAATTPRVTRVQ
ncbi:hypothetical protein CYMTET_33599 [Cymbomonas tetramitiformis]|uniref:Uncharacterized protein n=1 Tax=Cymbomonas tetramitiformis TaxID=36881 RepID=A0AAE0FCY0_9CHLO|nr:hypothetical protein CYMTET_33599 [Cymbomonas tetramitiformis]